MKIGVAKCVIVGCLGLVGCGEEAAPPAPVVKDVAAERPAAAVAPVAAPVAAVEAMPIACWVPADWERVAGEKPMRVATFRRARVPGEEIVVSQFPGDVGGVLANVNRWRAQVGLAPTTEAQLPSELRPFDNGKLKGHVMRLRGERQHMLAAIISDPDADRTWFVKAVTSPMAADTLAANLFGFATSFGTGQPSAEFILPATPK